MRLISNNGSVARGEVSLLAITETCLAVALTFYLSAHFNTLRWLATATCLAPILLLRTGKSVELGVSIFDRLMRPIRDLSLRAMNGLAGPIIIGRENHIPTAVAHTHRLFGYGTVLPLWAVSLFAALVARVTATIWASITHPLTAFKAIPDNWARITLTTDICTPLEIVPGHPISGQASLQDQEPMFLDQPSGDTPATGTALFMPSLLLPSVVIRLLTYTLAVPALFYRWSLKATSIVYSPLFFLARSTFHEGTDFPTELKLICRGDFHRILEVYSRVSIALFILKFILMQIWQGFVDWWQIHPLSQFLALYVVPEEIPIWHLVHLLNSVLVVVFMFVARRALLRIELGLPLLKTANRRALGLINGLHWPLAIYPIVCTAYITVQAARNWHWPSIGTKWVPW